MKKSFKKSIAVLLSVLMVLCVMPLSAFAAEDPKPNVNLQFNAFSNAGSRSYTNYGAIRNNQANRQGLYSAPLDYDKNAGTLTLAASKATATSTANGWNMNVSGDYTYGVGDFFSVTVRLDNVSKIAAAQVAIQYSNSIEPAGLYATNASSVTLYGKSNWPTGNGNSNVLAVDPGYPVAAQSAAGIYDGLNDGLVKDASYTDSTTRTIYTYVSNQDANTYTSVASVPASNKFTNPDGTIGNTFNNQAILATYIFKIVSTGAITFSLADASDVDSCYYLADSAAGVTPDKYLTYAQTDNAGSTGVTFMGRNEYDAAQNYTIVFKNANGTVISSATYAEGAEIVIPDLPIKAADDDYHYTTAWDAQPTTTAVEDAVYTVVETPVAHTFSEEITVQPTPSTEGEKTLTCDICGYTKTETIAPSACDHTNCTVTEQITKAATCQEEGTKVITTTCTNCGNVSTETVAIPRTSHNWSDWVYDGNAEYVSASNYTDGTETRTCSVCGETQSQSVHDTGLLRARTANCDFQAEIKMCIGTRTAQVNTFDEVYCKFTREDGAEFIVEAEDSYVSGSNTFFDFGVTPQGLASPVTIVYYGVRNGRTYWGPEYVYKMTSDYILKQLAKTTITTAWRTLLVELVYYGYEAQLFSKWDLEHPLIDLLEASDKACHDTSALTLQKITDTAYVSNPTAETTWRSVTMVFGASAKIQYRTRAITVTDDLKAVVQVEGESTPYVYEYSNEADAYAFSSDGTGGIYFTFDKLKPTRLRSAVYVTLYKGNTPVTDTMRYSAESYAQGKKTTANDYAISQQLMRYCNAAKTHFKVS